MTSCVTIDRMLDDLLDSAHQLLVCGSFVESLLQSLPVVFLETFHVFAVGHYLYSFNDFSFVVANKFEGEEEEMFEVKEDI